MKKLSNSGNNSFLIRASLVTGLVIGFLIGGTFIYHAGSNESDTYQAVIFNTISGTATIVDPINFNIATEIPFEISPGQYGAHFNSKLNKLYLIHHGQSEILVLDPQTLENACQKIKSGTKLLIINSPNNPTGTTHNDFKNLCAHPHAPAVKHIHLFPVKSAIYNVVIG